jgi:hypothetical protein
MAALDQAARIAARDPDAVVRLTREALDLLKAHPTTPLPEVGKLLFPGEAALVAGQGSEAQKLTALAGDHESWLNRTDRIERTLSSGRFTLSPSPRDTNAKKIQVGYLLDDQGKAVHAIRRNLATNDEAGNDVALYGLKKLSPFPTPFPVTVQRAVHDESALTNGDYTYQQRIGKSVFDRMWDTNDSVYGRMKDGVPPTVHKTPHRDGTGQTGMMKRLLGPTSEIPLRLELAAVEGEILEGERQERHFGNMLATMKNGTLNFANVDIREIGTNQFPDPASFPFLRGRKLSDTAMTYTDQFASFITSDKWRQSAAAGLITPEQQNAMLSRALWHLEVGEFRDHTFKGTIRY